MADSRQRISLQPSSSYSAISTASSSTSSSTDSASRSLKRRHTSTGPTPPATSDMSVYRSSSHYPDSAYLLSKPPAPRLLSSSRGPLPATLPAMDPTPDDDDAVFIHPPFTDFPDAHNYREGLTYTVMAANPNWFLDPADYQTVNGGNPDALKYPTQLEPPRGWCPSKKKESKEAWPEGEEPRLRCTFCRRTYAGVNAKSMWRRHVFEKHKIAMSNRRADNQERKGRGANKENKEETDKSAGRGAARAEVELEAIIRAPGMKAKSRSTGQLLESSQGSSRRALSLVSVTEDPADEDEVEESHLRPIEPQLAVGNSTLPFDPDSSDVFRVATSSSTPPLTPGLSPSSSARLPNATVESPYNPLLTPSFRHSPARLPSDQPWRFPSPSHPLHSSARELSLSMLVCGESSPTVRGLDVSPVVLMHASERSKRSIFSSPFALLKKDAETPGVDKSRAFPKPSPRRLFSESGLPTPLTDRLKFQKHRIPESPLGKGFTPVKNKTISALSQRSDVFRSSFSPFKSSSPLKTPHKGTGLLGAFDLPNEDPFADNLYKAWLNSPVVVSERPISPPDSSPECESPVLRASQLAQGESSLSSSQTSLSAPKMTEADSTGLGIGLMEGFSLRDRIASGDSSEVEVDEELMFPANPRKRPAKSFGRSFVTADGSPAPVVQAGKKIKREFLMDRLLNGDLDHEIHEAFQPKKRRKTINNRD